LAMRCDRTASCWMTGNTCKTRPSAEGRDRYVQEFRVETNASSATNFEPAANAIFSTRAGTNELHGSAFENGRTAVRVARRGRTPFQKTHLVRKLAPHRVAWSSCRRDLQREESHVLLGAWRNSVRGRPRPLTSAVWTDAMRRVDFRGLVDSSGRVITCDDHGQSAQGPRIIRGAVLSGISSRSANSVPWAKVVSVSVTPVQTAAGCQSLVPGILWSCTTNTDQRTVTFGGDPHATPLSYKDRFSGGSGFSPGQSDSSSAAL